MKCLQLAFGFEVTLQMSDVRVIAAVALQFVEDFEEHSQDQITTCAMIGLAVDIEKDDIGAGGDRPLDVRKEHGVLHLALKEINGLPGLPVMRVLPVVEQIRQHFQKVRLARTKKS